jgi:hypothetical protein
MAVVAEVVSAKRLMSDVPSVQTSVLPQAAQLTSQQTACA